MSLNNMRVQLLLYGAILLCSYATATDTSGPKEVSRNAQRETLVGPMWFGPRLGKRDATRPSYVYADPFIILLRVLEAMDAVYGGDSRYYAPASRKQYFTPRPGREVDPNDLRAVDLVPTIGQLLASGHESGPYQFSSRLGSEFAR